MPINRLGYACICMALTDERKPKERVLTGRSCRMASLSPDKINELCVLNSSDLIKILGFNKQHNIYYFRVGSDLFPFYSHPDHLYDIRKVFSWAKIERELALSGKYARDNNMRLSCHPGQYTCLASPNEDVVKKSILELEYHSLIGDLLGYGSEWKINVHVGGSYEGLEQTAERFCKHFDRLSPKTKERLTVENDDTPSMWSTKQLYQMIHKKIGIPLCFDSLHWSFHKDNQTLQEAAEMAFSTWGNEIPEAHHSESKDGTPSHSDLILSEIPEFSQKVKYDLMLEAKHKEKAVLGYRKKFNVKV